MTYDVLCPICGKINCSLYLEETDGWMECEHCGESTQNLRFEKTRKIPVFRMERLKLTKPHWYVFTVRENGRRVSLNRMLGVCKELQLETVPIEEVGMDLPAKYPTVEALLERAEGDYPNGGKKEGIVIRPTEPVYCELISAALSMKVVSNKYLLKNEE